MSENYSDADTSANAASSDTVSVKKAHSDTINKPDANVPGSCCCSQEGDDRHTYRDSAEKKALMRRLSIVEGQIRGIKGMLDNDCYCIDILTQVSAANSALNCFSRELLSEHLKNCVWEDVREGHEDKLDEVIKILPKLMK